MTTEIIEERPITVCVICKYFVGNERTCKAFPFGIPDVILAGEFDHNDPYPGDNGIQFEPIEDEYA